MSKAAKWYCKAFFHGRVNAAYWAALSYENLGQEDKALDMCRRGTNAGNSSCAHHLGSCYRDGKGGLHKDFEKALYYYKLAIELGDTIGYPECYIADMLLTGWRRIPANRDEAIQRFWQAANKGCDPARQWLIDHDKVSIATRLWWAL